ncbi:MAG: chorismate-binding protein [Flavobacteriales bacterium]|nr:chorismate-binding protein [Flavobacteriales bacterium]
MPNKTTLVAYRLPLETRSFLLREAKQGEHWFEAKAFIPSAPHFRFYGHRTSYDKQANTLNEALQDIIIAPKNTSSTTKENHLQNCQRAIEKLSNKDLDKVVLSRVHYFPTAAAKADQLFTTLCEVYPNAFVYFLIHPELGVWCGASPEVLIDKKGSTYETMALAGTIDTTSPREWTAKEFKEQQLVSDYIEERLSTLSPSDLKVHERTEQQAGHLKHLKTQIDFKYNGELNTLLSLLHPTPAVAGTPLDQAIDLILELEQHQRELYTGFLGLNTDEKSSTYYVNLRCMQWTGQGYLLYAGGGITSESSPLSEWQETNSKLQVLQGVLEKL